MLQQADKMGCREFVTAQVPFHKNYLNHDYHNFDDDDNYDYHNFDEDDNHDYHDFDDDDTHDYNNFDDDDNHDYHNFDDDFQDVKNGHQRLNLAFTANLFNK